MLDVVVVIVFVGEFDVVVVAVSLGVAVFVGVNVLDGDTVLDPERVFDGVGETVLDAVTVGVVESDDPADGVVR